MIYATPPQGVLRSWVCAYCDAHGPASSEEHCQELTAVHLVNCAARLTWEVRHELAMNFLEDPK